MVMNYKLILILQCFLTGAASITLSVKIHKQDEQQAVEDGIKHPGIEARAISARPALASSQLMLNQRD